MTRLFEANRAMVDEAWAVRQGRKWWLGEQPWGVEEEERISRAPAYVVNQRKGRRTQYNGMNVLAETIERYAFHFLSFQDARVYHLRITTLHVGDNRSFAIPSWPFKKETQRTYLEFLFTPCR